LTFTTCTFSGNTYGAYSCASRFIDCDFSSNTTADFSQPGQNVGRHCSLNSATQHNAYAGTNPVPGVQTVMWDIGGVAGYVKAWMAGGRIVPDLTTVPNAAFTHSHQFIFEYAQTTGVTAQPTPVCVDFPVGTNGQGKIDLTIYLRRDTEAMTEMMRAQIIDLADDPLFGGTPLAEAVMTAGANAWQSMALTTVISDSQQVALRLYGRNASGNAWAQWQVTPPVALDPALAVAITEDSLVVEVTD